MSRNTLFIIFGYLISSIVLTAGLFVAFGFYIFFASIFGDPTFLYILAFGVPQLILIPLFIVFYLRDRKLIKEGKLQRYSLSFTQSIILIFLTLLILVFAIKITFFPNIFKIYKGIPLIILSNKTEYLNSDDKCYSKQLMPELDKEFRGSGYSLRYPSFLEQKAIHPADATDERSKLELSLSGGEGMPFVPYVTILVKKELDDESVYFEFLKVGNIRSNIPCSFENRANYDISSLGRKSYIQSHIKFLGNAYNHFVLRFECLSEDNRICNILVSQIISTLNFTE